MNKKGQAAMEFLMTYGWAILVVLAAIGALAYFGVSPDNYIPEQCNFYSASSKLNCDDWTATTADNITLRVQNNADFEMSNLTIAFLDSEGCTDTSPSIDLGAGEADTISITCAQDFSSSKVFKSDVEISYINDKTKLNHEKRGDIVISLPK